MIKTGPEEQHFFLSSLSPGLAQKRLALAVVLVLLLVLFLFAGPLSSTEPRRIDAFVPAYAMAMFVIDSITAVLLFAQFSILRLSALLAIACGYVFTALILFPWMLAFPGIFTPGGILGAELQQSTLWLYILWHAGFPMFVIAYVHLKDANPAKRLWHGSARAAIVSSVAGTAAVVGTATFVIMTEDARLPRIALDPVRFSSLWFYATGFMVLLSGVALIKLWIRWRSVLDLWLMVVVCAYLTEVYLTSFPAPVRFSNGWYAGRFCGFISGSLVLFVLLYEITMLYAQLLRAVGAQRREREARLVTGDAIAAMISHEIKQPLSAMILRSQTGLRWLDRSVPDPDKDKATAEFRQVAADAHRAAAVIESIRANFRKDARVSTSIDVNDLVAKTLNLIRDDMQRERILIKAEPKAGLPQIIGDEGQLQQVLLNLITNAVDAMKSKYGPRILSVDAAVHDSSGVVVSVADTGIGISSQDAEQVFNPMFTTKSGGMGMGLSICRSIIDAHGGRLWVAQNKGEGAVFQFLLPVDGATLM